MGSVTEAGATVLDSAADWVLTGKAPNIVSTAVGIVENAVINKITSLIPGGKAIVGEAKALKTEAKAEANATKNAIKQEEKAAEKAAKPKGGGNDNVNVPGRKKDGGRVFIISKACKNEDANRPLNELNDSRNRIQKNQNNAEESKQRILRMGERPADARIFS